MSTVEVIYDLLDVCVFVVESFMKAKAKCQKKIFRLFFEICDIQAHRVFYREIVNLKLKHSVKLRDSVTVELNSEYFKIICCIS